MLYNENATEKTDRYLGIIVADSDNDTYSGLQGKSDVPENATVATSSKASCINSYTIYELKSATMNLDGELTSFWYLPAYMPGGNYICVLKVYYSLKECTEQTMKDYAISVAPTPEPTPEPTPQPTPQPSPQKDSKVNESSDSSTENESTTIVTENESVIDQLVKAGRIEFQKDPETNKKGFLLRGASVNDKKYQWGTTYQLGKNWKYAFVANRALKLIGQITLDGKVLDPSEYTIISYDDVCVILFSADFMQNLSAGQHIFTFSCEGFDTQAQMTVMVTE